MTNFHFSHSQNIFFDPSSFTINRLVYQEIPKPTLSNSNEFESDAKDTHSRLSELRSKIIDHNEFQPQQYSYNSVCEKLVSDAKLYFPKNKFLPIIFREFSRNLKTEAISKANSKGELEEGMRYVMNQLQKWESEIITHPSISPLPIRFKSSGKKGNLQERFTLEIIRQSR